MDFLKKKYTIFIIMYIPLQQGLRLNYYRIIVITHPIIKYIPLQQGLRQTTSD